MVDCFREILVVDQVPIINEASDAFQRAYQSIASLKEDLNRYETEDLPAYNRWIHTNFGKILTRGRELSALISEKQSILTKVKERHWARFFDGSTYEDVESGIERGESRETSFCDMHVRWSASTAPDQAEIDGSDEFGPGFEEFRYEKQGSFYDDEDASYFDGDDDSVKQFEESFSRKSATDYSRSNPGFRSRGQERRTSSLFEDYSTLTENEMKQNRIKNTYRILVRKLHPDHNPDLSVEEKSLWHQVLRAYQDKDLEQLEVLLALSSVYAGHVGKGASLYQLRRATKEIERLVAPLKRKVEDARKNRAWKFSQLADRTALKQLIEFDFKKELAELRQKLSELDTLIMRFSRQT